MSYSIKSIPKFEKNLKKLAKKYPSLKMEYADLVYSLKENPTQGIDLGQNCYKIRLAIKSKGKGKSGGGRVVTAVVLSLETVYLLTIFDKSDKDNISDRELRELLKYVPE